MSSPKAHPERRLCLWSGPRNVSTALMYAFAQRPDTRVVDEPLYAHYLRVSGARHPGGDEVMAAGETDGERVVREVILGTCDRPLLFVKQMAHHLVDLDRSFLDHVDNVFLVREPREVLLSLRHQIPEPRPEETGLPLQAALLDSLRERGRQPQVLDARELLLDPEAVLRRLCKRLGIPFSSDMLSWPAGGRPEDGVWARHWYQNVHRSTGFGPYRAKSAALPSQLEPVYEVCRPAYEKLYAAAIRAPRDAADEETE